MQMGNGPGGERLWVGIQLPDAARASLCALTEDLPGVNWNLGSELHLTLRFLGEMDSHRREIVTERLAAIRVSSFLLPLAGVGAFPPHGPPRVVWTGTGTGHPRLFQLRQRLDDALLAAGVRLDVRTFSPHVTLARCCPEAEAAVTAWLRKWRGFEGPNFRVDYFGLFSSELRPSGAVHTLRARFPLAN